MLLHAAEAPLLDAVRAFEISVLGSMTGWSALTFYRYCRMKDIQPLHCTKHHTQRACLGYPSKQGARGSCTLLLRQHAAAVQCASVFMPHRLCCSIMKLICLTWAVAAENSSALSSYAYSKSVRQSDSYKVHSRMQKEF